MDQDFLKQLEQEVTDVGTDEVWKKPIGNKIIWLSPVTTAGQDKVRETMLSETLGSNGVFEAKKITLSRAIVGINKLDLRPYRKSGDSVFTISDARVGGDVQVNLFAYLLHKIEDWGSEFVDVTFDVFADLMAVHKKDLLKDIKFEGNQDPMMELAEIEDRAAIIREQLNLPPKVEMNSKLSKESIEEPKEEPSKVQERVQTQEDSKTPFDPFERVPSVPKAQEIPVVKQVPVQNIPVPVIPRTAEYAAIEGSLENPFKATPSVPNEVVETKLPVSGPIAPPIINPSQGGVNPRFRPQR